MPFGRADLRVHDRPVETEPRNVNRAALHTTGRAIIHEADEFAIDLAIRLLIRKTGVAPGQSSCMWADGLALATLAKEELHRRTDPFVHAGPAEP